MIFKEIICPLSRREQMYYQNILSVIIDFGNVGFHLIKPVTIHFSEKYSCGSAERRMKE